MLYTSSLKKTLIASVAGVMALGSISGVFAAANLIDNLENQGTQWESSVTAKDPTSTSVSIQFPVFNSNNEDIMNYTVSYTKGKSIVSADLTEIKKASFQGDKVKIDDKKVVTLTLEGLTAASAYYFVVTPVNKEGTDVTSSEQVTFTTLAEGATATTDTTATNGDGAMLGAADASSANFTYVLSGSKITLKWKAISGVSKFQFSMKEATGKTYANIGSETASKESFTFAVDKIGQYNIKIVPVDAQGAPVGGEKILTVKVDKVTSLPGKGTPATGPMLNLVLMSTFLMMLMYVVYRFRTTK